MNDKQLIKDLMSILEYNEFCFVLSLSEDGVFAERTFVHKDFKVVFFQTLVDESILFAKITNYSTLALADQTKAIATVRYACQVMLKEFPALIESNELILIDDNDELMFINNELVDVSDDVNEILNDE